MRQVVWSPRAVRANAEIIRYLVANVDERVAATIHQRILDAATKLGSVSTGRPGRLPGTHEKSVLGTSYIILYSRRSRGGRDYLVILDVVHSSRNWPRGHLPPSP